MAKVVDPVCKMEIEDASEFHITHGGKEYFFCGPACKTTFEGEADDILSGKTKIDMGTDEVANSDSSKFKLDFNVWWQRIILVFIVALFISVGIFIFKEKPFDSAKSLVPIDDGDHGHVEETPDDHHE